MKQIKNINLFSSIIMCIAIFFVACIKDKDGIYKSSEIIISDHSKMLISEYDSTIYGRDYSPVTMNLDLDHDGIDDISLLCVTWGSPGLGLHPSSSIICLREDVQLFVNSRIDTIYDVISFLYQNQSNNEIRVYESHHYSCTGNSAIDPIHEIIDASDPVALRSQEVLKVNEVFRSDTFLLSEAPSTLGPWPIAYSGDTIFMASYTFVPTCHIFPQDEVRYIGFKLVDKSKLGWIKLSIFNHSRIVVRETAIKNKLSSDFLPGF